MIGQILSNRYRLLRELGAGGMAWVYLADDVVKHTQVAVKVLYPQYNRDSSYVQRFVREAQVAIRLSSDHIVRILDYGADRDTHYLVMERLEGRDLAALLRERGRLPWREALEIASQVVSALKAANEHGIVHRDIKPQNIMVMPSGSVKVLDFGIARAHVLPTLTQTGFVGSPHYIAPEQAMGRQVDIRSDIYSLGILLYEALSGELPFDASTPWSIISQHIASEPPYLDAEKAGTPASVAAMINRMLAKDPDDRFQTPEELLQAIDGALYQGNKIDLPLSKPPSQAARVVQRDRARQLLLSSLYGRALDAVDAKEWPQAANLFTQIIKVAPHYKDAAQHLAHAGFQARLEALYSAALEAIEAKSWQQAIDELSEVVRTHPDYRDAPHLLEQAQASLADDQTRDRLDHLHQKALSHYQDKEWDEAVSCWTEIIETDPHHEDARRFLNDAQRRARWANSIVGRLLRQVAALLTRRRTPTGSDADIVADSSTVSDRVQ